MNFRRQTPIGPYVVDFSHRGSRLVIEIDGPFHEMPVRAKRDARRTAWLEAEGFRVVRFADREVRDRLFEVVERIVATTGATPIPNPSPLQGEGRSARWP